MRLWALLGILAACGGSPKPQDAASFLDQWLPVLCERSAACLPGVVYDECLTAGEEEYCRWNDCEDVEMAVGRAGWNACLQAYEEQSCEEVQTGVFPVECDAVEAFGL